LIWIGCDGLLYVVDKLGGFMSARCGAEAVVGLLALAMSEASVSHRWPKITERNCEMRISNCSDD